MQTHVNKPIKFFYQSKLDELYPDFNFDGGGETTKVTYECALIIFHLPLKIVRECVVFYSCVYFLFLLFFY